MMEWVGHVACKGEKRSAYMALLLKSKGKRPLGRPRHRWERTDWINQAQDNGNEPLRSIKCKKFLNYVRKYQLLEKDPASWSLLVELVT
jgi:hypothetical protein